MASTEMSNKVVVVSGATQGIGFEAAKALANKGARVVITARDQGRGEKAVADLKRLTGNDRVEVVLVDFASMQSIKDAAHELHNRIDRLDVLLNNAGAVYSDHLTSKDGLELTFATNHIGYFLFTHLLLDLLKQSAPARIVNVASDAHKAARSGIDFDDLERKRGYTGFVVYGETKLMNILFTRELARRLEGTGVTVNCLHPGVIASGFGTNNSGLLGFATRNLGKYFLITPEQGAQTSIYLCTSPDVAGVSGKYFAKSKEAKTTRHGVDDAAAKKLWELSEKITGVSSSQAAA
jgi:NAD(P)-dependent dehydrogenase (short-subunit alcohol dehydrogenase family)